MRLEEACCRRPHYQLFLGNRGRQGASLVCRVQKVLAYCSRGVGAGFGSWTSLRQPVDVSMFVPIQCGGVADLLGLCVGGQPVWIEAFIVCHNERCEGSFEEDEGVGCGWYIERRRRELDVSAGCEAHQLSPIVPSLTCKA
jgi:hypothetical protein